MVAYEKQQEYIKKTQEAYIDKYRAGIKGLKWLVAAQSQLNRLERLRGTYYFHIIYNFLFPPRSDEC